MDLDLSDPAARSVRLTWIPGNDNRSPITRQCTHYYNCILSHPLDGSKRLNTESHLVLKGYYIYVFMYLSLAFIHFSSTNAAFAVSTTFREIAC